MRYLSLIACLGLVLTSASCMQTENSNSQDKSTWGNFTGPFGEAKSIMAQNCAQCHDYHTRTEDQLVTAGVLVKGNALNSKIYNRLTGSSGSGNKNMPSGGSLTAGEVETIFDWIQQAN